MRSTALLIPTPRIVGVTSRMVPSVLKVSFSMHTERRLSSRGEKKLLW